MVQLSVSLLLEFLPGMAGLVLSLSRTLSVAMRRSLGTRGKL